MKQNMNSAELFRALNYPDDETLLHLAEHYKAADQDTMERIFKKSQQKYMEQTAAKEQPQTKSHLTETVADEHHFTTQITGKANTDRNLQDLPEPGSEPTRRSYKKIILSVLSAAACLSIVCLELYGAFSILMLKPQEQGNEQNDTTSSKENSETQETTQTTVTTQISETKTHMETGIIFEMDPVETTSAIYTGTTVNTSTTASTTTSTTSAPVTTYTQTTAFTARTTAAQTPSATKVRSVSTNRVSDSAAQTEVPMTATTAVQEETSATTVTTASAETMTSMETTTTAEHEAATAQETEPAAQEIPTIPGFTVQLTPRQSYSEEEDISENDVMVRQIQAIPDPDAPQTIEQHYEITELPVQFTYIREHKPSDTNEEEYGKFYQIQDGSSERTKDLKLWQFVQEQFEDTMMQYSAEYYDTHPGVFMAPEIHPIRINDQPGFYYGIQYNTEPPHIGYVLYWKQDGYVMMLFSNTDVSLEEMVKAAESVKPEA